MWNVPTDQINEFKFYSFLKNFHELDGNFNDLNNVDPTKQVISVLDGQQRITSLFIAMKGTYTEIKRNKEKVKELYFNLIGFAGPEEEKKYFKLLTEEDARKDKGAVWLKVGDFLQSKWTRFAEAHARDLSLWDDIVENHPQGAAIEEVLNNFPHANLRIIGALERIVKMIHTDENISYYEVQGSEGLDTVTEIFIRINSGGKVLSKSDLLFSTVVSRWQEGREKIDDLLKELKEMGFEMDTDFVMRTCLYLTGSPILFKVGNFKNDTVTKIINTFETEGDELDIKTSIIQAFAFLKQELGIYDKLLKSNNVLIPLIYHVYKGGILDENSLREVQQYLYVSLLQGVFGSHGDTLLSQMREGVSNRLGAFTAVGQPFNFQDLISKVTEKAKIHAYRITESVLVSWLKKKDDEAYMVLSLAYGTSLPYDYNSYSLGTLHPLHFFKKSAFPEGEFAEINSLTKLVPALMFVSARDMELRKEDHALLTYIQTILPARGINPQEYKDLHLIGATDSLELLQFKGLFEARAQRIMNILSALLINPTTVPPTGGDDEDEDDDDFESDEVTPTPPAGGVGHSNGTETAQPSDSTLLNRFPEELDRLEQLYRSLNDTEINFIAAGEYPLKEILDQVKMKFPDLCNDAYLCIQHCLSGNKAPEWEHRVRSYLSSKKDRPNSRVRRTLDGKKWKLI
jgi:hypothetical protein